MAGGFGRANVVEFALVNARGGRERGAGFVKETLRRPRRLVRLPPKPAILKRQPTDALMNYRFIAPVLGLAIVVALGFAFRPSGTAAAASVSAPAPGAEDLPEAAAASIAWMTWEDAVAANAKAPKRVLVDVYTDWCGWCKRMDATTFKDPKVADLVRENFYAVKLNAEQREDIVYDGHTFKFERMGNRGAHQLAASLLDNRLSYPSIVYLNADMERVMISPGYKDPAAMLTELAQVMK